MTFNQIIKKVFKGAVYQIKRVDYVKPKRQRDALGRFTGKIRKGYSRRYKDYDKPKIKTRDLMKKNIEENNALLKKLQHHKICF